MLILIFKSLPDLSTDLLFAQTGTCVWKTSVPDDGNSSSFAIQQLQSDVYPDSTIGNCRDFGGA